MTMPTPSDAPQADRREIILAQATLLFNANGFADTRLEDIGDRLGTVKTSISYYFRSKDRLLEEIYDRTLTFSAAALDVAMAAPTGLDGLMSWVNQHARAHADALAGLAQPLALIADLPDENDASEGSLTRRYLALVDRCRGLILRGQADGSIGVKSVDGALFFVLNMMHWLPRWLAEIRLPDMPIALEGLDDLLRRGIVADRKRPHARAINRTVAGDVDSVFDRTARNRMKRDALLRVGTRVLNEKGYRSLSLSEVAAELGVTRGAFYYHIADKEALLLGCFERSCDLLETAQSLATLDGMSGMDVLERALRWLYDRQVSNLDPLLRLGLLSSLDEASRKLVTARLNRTRAGFAQMISRAMMDRSIRSLDVAAAEQLVLGAIFAGSQRRLALLRLTGGAGGRGGGISFGAYLETLFYGLAGDEARRRTPEAS